MLIEPVSAIFFIHLNKAESKDFTKMFPSSRDIEAFVEKIEEKGATISVFTDEPKAIRFHIEVDSNIFQFVSDTKKEVRRIASAIENALAGVNNEIELSND
jgi:hypothetical protein